MVSMGAAQTARCLTTCRDEETGRPYPCPGPNCRLHKNRGECQVLDLSKSRDTTTGSLVVDHEYKRCTPLKFRAAEVKPWLAIRTIYYTWSHPTTMYLEKIEEKKCARSVIEAPCTDWDCPGKIDCSWLGREDCPAWSLGIGRARRCKSCFSNYATAVANGRVVTYMPNGYSCVNEDDMLRQTIGCGQPPVPPVVTNYTSCYEPERMVRITGKNSPAGPSRVVQLGEYVKGCFSYAEQGTRLCKIRCNQECNNWRDAAMEKGGHERLNARCHNGTFCRCINPIKTKASGNRSQISLGFVLAILLGWLL